MIKGIPILSICIPTYNRVNYINILIDSIVSQRGFTDEIEIVINDGPSTDNTEQLVREYQKKYQNIRYFRNDKAIGMLPAILESLSQSNGKYTRLFGSDDFMQKDSLEIVVNIIKHRSPALILSNRFVFNNIDECDSSVLGQTNLLYFQGFSEFSVYLGLDEKDKIEDKGNYFTFMSVFCFETNYYKKMLDFVNVNVCSIEELNRNYFNYIIVLFSGLTHDKTICIIEKPRLVFCKADNHGWRLNRKIFDDYVFLVNLVEKIYKLNVFCKKFLMRNIRGLWLALYVYSPIINTKIVKFLKYNNNTKDFYKNICSFISKII